MVAWERDRSVPQGASMLLPMAWSPLFWLAVLLEARVGWSSTVTLLFVGLGSVTAGFPLFLLSEDRPFAQQKARVGLGALALLCVVALMDLGLPFWGLCVLGLVLWFSLPAGSAGPSNAGRRPWLPSMPQPRSSMSC